MIVLKSFPCGAVENFFFTLERIFFLMFLKWNFHFHFYGLVKMKLSSKEGDFAHSDYIGMVSYTQTHKAIEG